jgi:hypothetical protein
MKTRELQINHNYCQVLTYAIFDNKINNNCFRLLCYIASKCDKYQILNSDIKKEILIKCNNTLANCFNILIDNLYIIRTSSKKTIKKNVSSYIYSINTYKPQLPLNGNLSLINCSDDDFILKLSNEVFNHFFKKIPASTKVDISKNIKSIQLMLSNDGYSKQDLIIFIDYISSIENLKNTITRPILLRDYLKSNNLKSIIKKDK